MKKSLIIFLGIGFCAAAVYSYENTKAHPALNNAVISVSEQTLVNKLPPFHTWKITNDQELYRGRAVVNPGYSVATFGEGEKSFTLPQWIEHGGYSADEPELAAAIRHFYDPTGHQGGRKYLTNRGTYWEWLYTLHNLLNPEIDAIEWALGDTPKGAENWWSLAKAKRYLIYAFEYKEEDLKKENLAKAFRCLGEVLHNTADMGCPPHVRNDSHAAPMGYEWYAVLGSPDPYEELFDPQWASEYMNGNPDPALEVFFNQATSIRSIHEKLAEFTNRNFFTEQTINGVGSESYPPINADGDYPQPLLQNLDYRADDYTFYRTFPSGNRVKMCKDKRIFSRRGQPYIDYDCAKSQASELVPNILCAGANVIRLFLPEFQITIREAKPDEDVNGEIIHVPNGEYPTTILYSGPIELVDAKTNRSIAEFRCIDGDFSGRVDGIKYGDRLIARITLGGLTVQSPVYEIKESAGANIQNITIMIIANMPAGNDNQQVALNITNIKPTDDVTTIPLVWNGTLFSAQYVYNYLPLGSELRATLRGAISGEISQDFKKLIRLEGEETCQYPELDGAVLTVTERVKLEDIDLTVQANAFLANYSGLSWQKKLKSIYFSSVWSDSPESSYTSDTIDWNAVMPPALNVLLNLSEN